MMNEQKRIGWTPEECSLNERTRLSQSKSKINRLRRSPRRTQQPQAHDSTSVSNSVQTDFKTPTRPTKTSHRTWITDDSPNHDGGFQQDIVWDPNSPSPIQHGRGRRRIKNVGVVDISDIVKRIAPKSGRPEMAETSLLQWIGDSAIPCTPEVSQPRTRVKPQRPNAVSDLMRLAQQFDSNLIQQDEPNTLETGRLILEEVIEEDQELFDDENIPLSTHAHSSPHPKITDFASESANVSNKELLDHFLLDLGMDDDLDVLFDSSTQQISHCLSQASSNQVQDGPKTTPIFSSSSNKLAGKGCDPKPVGTSDVTIVPGSSCQANNEVPANDDDDWNNDDLLNDSLVFEMTQNPNLFIAPQHFSTQKVCGGETNSTLTNNRTSYATRNENKQPSKTDVRSSTAQGHSHRVQSRQTFQLNPNPACKPKEKPFSGLPGNRYGSRNETSGSNSRLSPAPSKTSVVALGQKSNAIHNQPCQRTTAQTRAPAGRPSGTSTSSSSSFITNSSSSWPSHTVNRTGSVSSTPLKKNAFKPETVVAQLPENAEGPKEKVKGQVATLDGFCDIPVEELDSIFAMDPVWDDSMDDDDLFREVCENLEETSGSLALKVTKPAPKPTGWTDTARTKTTTLSEVNSLNNATYSNKTQKESVFTHPYPSSFSPHNSNKPRYSIAQSKHAPAIQKQMPSPSCLNANMPKTGAEVNSMMRPSNIPSTAPYKFSQVKNSTIWKSTTSSAVPSQQVSGRSVLTSDQSCVRNPDSLQVRKPYSVVPSSTPVASKDLVASPAGGRCSEAEIKRKKQEAMERRRLRMLASQNFRAPV